MKYSPQDTISGTASPVVTAKAPAAAPESETRPTTRERLQSLITALGKKNKTKAGANDFAVIIGNRIYKKGPPNVEFAHNDIELMKAYATAGLGFREGNVIVFHDATQSELIGVFGNENNHKGQLYNWLRAGESNVFIFYSGHGSPGLSNGRGYLLPVDANPDTVELNGYSIDTLYANLGKLPAKSLTVIIDACFSGNSPAGMVIKNASPTMLKVLDSKPKLPTATIITAAGASEIASWDQEVKAGLLTRYFIEGATGMADQDGFGNKDGKITLGELKKYLESEVSYMARRMYSREQHPQVQGQFERVIAAANR